MNLNTMDQSQWVVGERGKGVGEGEGEGTEKAIGRKTFAFNLNSVDNTDVL